MQKQLKLCLVLVVLYFSQLYIGEQGKTYRYAPKHKRLLYIHIQYKRCLYLGTEWYTKIKGRTKNIFSVPENPVYARLGTSAYHSSSEEFFHPEEKGQELHDTHQHQSGRPPAASRRAFSSLLSRLYTVSLSLFFTDKFHFFDTCP